MVTRSGAVVRAFCAFTLGFGAMGCAGADGQGEEAEPLGTAELDIVSLPAGAQCLQLTGSGGSTFSMTFTLTGSTVTIGRLPLATMTINASVWNVACTALSGVAPTWVADPQTASFKAGVTTNLTLNLRANNSVSSTLNFIGNISGVSANYWGSGLWMGDGTVRMAGSWLTLYGGNFFAPSSVAMSGVLELAGGKGYNSHGCVRTSSQLLCWGQNTVGELGTGVPIGNYVYTPTAVAGISGSNITQIAIGDHHTCVLSSANIYCWGANGSGQLGLGNTANLATPTFVPSNSTPVALAAGYNFTCAISYAGTYCWGDNSSGQLGDGTTTQRLTPTKVVGLTGAVSLAIGGLHACAARADGTVRCWGSNSTGQLGDGTTTQRLTPVQVSGITDAVQVTAGAGYSCARRANGQVSCWGEGDYGQIGDGAATGRLTPTAVAGVTGAVALASGQYHNCVLQDNQTVQCWGWDINGNCGDNNAANNFKPIPAVVQ